MKISITLQRTTSDNPDFQELANELEQDLKARDGEQHLLYAELNKIDKIPNAVVAYLNGVPAGCGAIREYNKDNIELKRMFVKPENRGKKIATAILTELENWSAELGYKNCVLETGLNQPEAIELYKSKQYSIIPNFGKYANSENSICFQKSFEKLPFIKV
jgi:putative acetyltransferase